jgi:predicted transcriptional regulator
MKYVHDILRQKHDVVNWVSPETLVVDALHAMKALDVSYVIVLKNGDYNGLFCERSYARDLVLRGLKSNATTVKQVMIKDLPVVRPSYTVEECRLLLFVYRSNYLLCFDEADKFLDVITVEDVLFNMGDCIDPPLPRNPQFHFTIGV